MITKQEFKEYLKRLYKKFQIEIFFIILSLFILFFLLIYSVKISNFLFNSNVILILIFLVPLIIFYSIIKISLTKEIDEKTKRDEIYRNIEILLTFSTVLILLFQGIILLSNSLTINKQTEIFDRQTELMEGRPEILLWSSQGPISYQIDEFKKRGDKIGIGVTNLGRANIPQTTISINNQNELFWGFEYSFSQSGKWNVKNLESMDYTTTWFNLTIREDEKMNLSKGVYNLDFRIFCPICKNQIEYQTIKICLYNNEATECGED